jgi:hypothetical protein
VKGFAFARRLAPRQPISSSAVNTSASGFFQLGQVDALDRREGCRDEGFGVARAATEKLAVPFGQLQRFIPVWIVGDRVGVTDESEFSGTDFSL